LDYEDFVNINGPIWEAAYKNKTWDQKVGELLYGITVTAAVVGAAFEAVAIIEAIGAFGLSNAVNMYNTGTLNENLYNYKKPSIQGQVKYNSKIDTTKGTSKTVRETLLDSVSNQKLKNAINEIYRPGAKIGDGGLADAIKHELKTGELVGGKSHIIKGTERVKNLENIIKTQNLNQSDLNIAQKLLNDLKNALGGK